MCATFSWRQVVLDRIPEGDALAADARLPSCFHASGDALLERLFWFAIGVSTLTATYAALSARGLIYDGAFYLIGIAATRSFHLVEPARVSVQVLQQLPAVLGIRFGIENLWTLAKLFSLGMYGWPVVLTAICWFVLPRGEKSWIAGPLINFVFAIPAANFIGISEGVIASCLVWLAVLLVMFRLSQPAGALAALAASAACAAAHEAILLCLLLVAWLAVAQIRHLNGFSRVVSMLVALVNIAGAMYMARWIAAPRSVIERGDFLVSVLGGFVGSPAAPNLAAIASVLAAVFVITMLVARRQSTNMAIVGVLVVAACGIVFALAPAALASPSRFFAARGLPIIVTTVLVGAFAWLRARGATPAPFVTRPVIAVALALILAQTSMQMVATSIWREYVSDLRGLVASNRGVISHAAAMSALDPDNSRFRRELLESWSVEPLGILLAPGGRVVAVVEPTRGARWVPYQWNKPQTLPCLPQLDWSHFAAPRES